MGHYTFVKIAEKWFNFLQVDSSLRKLEAVAGTSASKVCKYSAVYAEQRGGLRDGVGPVGRG